jgi:hypothetical protein
VICSTGWETSIIEVPVRILAEVPIMFIEGFRVFLQPEAEFGNTIFKYGEITSLQLLRQSFLIIFPFNLTLRNFYS